MSFTESSAATTACRRLCGVVGLCTVAVIVTLLPTPLPAAGEAGDIRTETNLFLFQDSDTGAPAVVQVYLLQRFQLPELAVGGLQLRVNRGKLLLELRAASSGDELYRESRVGVALGHRFATVTTYAGLTVYSVSIARFGSAAAPALDAGVSCQPAAAVHFEAGVDRLAAGKLRPGGRDLDPFSWLFARLDADDAQIAGAAEFPARREAGFALAASFSPLQRLNLTLFMGVNPGRLGMGITLTAGRAAAGFAFWEEPPLGWCRGYGTAWRW